MNRTAILAALVPVLTTGCSVLTGRQVCAAEPALRAEGVPFDVVLAGKDAVSDASLRAGRATGGYQAVVHANDLGGPMRLGSRARTSIQAHADEFGIREVISFGAPPAGSCTI